MQEIKTAKHKRKHNPGRQMGATAEVAGKNPKARQLILGKRPTAEAQCPSG